MRAVFSAFLGGILVALAFPTMVAGVRFPDLSWLAWVGLVPFFASIRNLSIRQVVVAGFVCGLTYNALVSYWIFNALHFQGGFHPLPSLLGVVTMSAIFGVMLGIFLAATAWLKKRWDLPFVIVIPVFWVLYEWTRTHGPFGGYPWANLAYSQGSQAMLIQIADIFGVYGIGFLIIFCNAVLSEVVLWMCRGFVSPSPQPPSPRGRGLGGGGARFPTRSIVVLIVLLLAFLAYGHFRLAMVEKYSNEAEKITVALIQPNIPQELKEDPGEAERTLSTLKMLTEQSFVAGTDIAIWPESSYPDLFPTDLGEVDEFAGWERPVLVGSVTASRDEFRFYNSGVLILPGGVVKGFYHKSHLVPMGEYVPLRRFLEWMDPPIGDFTEGDESNPMEVGGVQFGVTICYEDLFPGISRNFARSGASFLVNITNDAWYGRSSAYLQHLEFSRFRAIENRRSMVRSTNTGLTAVIDPSGKLVGSLPPFSEGVLVHSIPLVTEKTFYSRYGDLPWLILFVLMSGSLGVKRFVRFKKSHRPRTAVESLASGCTKCHPFSRQFCHGLPAEAS